MPSAAPVLFAHAAPRLYTSSFLQSAILKPPALRLSSSPLRHVRARVSCMSSERHGEPSPSSCQTPRYGASEPLHPQHPTPAHTSSTNDSAIDAPLSAAANEMDSRLIGTFVFLGTSLVLGSIAAATGFLSPDTLMRIARWFEQLGPAAIYLYSVLYFLLELVAVPAIPLTLGSGYLFGLVDGTIAISISSTIAAAVSFLIARYGLRSSVSRIAERNARFRVLDRAIGREGFKFVLLLRLSPLLPFALSNYLYGLTSVNLGEYIFGSWLGMLPGTIAYVSAGAAVNALTDLHEGQSATSPWLIVTGLVATIAVLTRLGKLAQEAIESVEEEEMPQHQ